MSPELVKAKLCVPPHAIFNSFTFLLILKANFKFTEDKK
jgi:hypothetical protein